MADEGMLAGRYRRLKTIGVGGMARVVLAQDERLGRQVAIKRLHADSPGETAKRFEREARLGASLNHQNIVAIYDVLLQAEPSPVVELNRAVAVAMRDGPAAGLGLIDAILDRGDLADYHLAHSARAELCRRLGRKAEARAAYGHALELTRQEPERQFLLRRLAELPE